MNLTKKDLNVLLVLLIVLLVGIYYFVPYKQINSQEKKLSQQLASLQTEYNILQQDVLKQETYEKEIIDFKRFIEGSNDRFPTDVNQERIIYTLNDMENKLDIEFTSVTFGEDEIVAVSDQTAYEQEQKHIEEVNKLMLLNKEDEIEEIDLEGYDMLIKKSISTSVYTDYQGIKNLLDYLYPAMDEMNNVLAPNNDPLLDRRIVLESISIAKSDQESENDFDVSFILNFYALRNPDREETNIYLGEYGMGKENGIFEVYESLGGNDAYTGEQENVTVGNSFGQLIEGEPDFFIMLNPQKADIDSVVVGKANDNSRETYVYTESSSVTDVEINVFTYNNEYYYKYKSGTDAYPSNYNSGIKFIPGEYIELKVISTERNAVDDLAGANVTIINNTDTPFNIYFYNEDEMRPRFNLIRTEGNVVTP